MYKKKSSGYECKDKSFDIVVFLICHLSICLHSVLSLEVIHKPLLFVTVLSIGPDFGSSDLCLCGSQEHVLGIIIKHYRL